jgi:hypothetical protein
MLVLDADVPETIKVVVPLAAVTVGDPLAITVFVPPMSRTGDPLAVIWLVPPDAASELAPATLKLPPAVPDTMTAFEPLNVTGVEPTAITAA